ncbi:hypothetical protein GPJ56_008319 [Histomonas meleagridis]|uniref:uncharacterized protein n=1 Tax=Histomonas meleagridis TaxID=135588 RepID=UPI00355A8883|nr:hypothetical protein GPJ56_008319 [Histomonas meleagridis]KAH0806890.1 hypothetical protein GO595_000066 [Histomonas meleagridis]
MFLPMIANMGPTLWVNFALNGLAALTLPFEIPTPLKGILQYGLPQGASSDSHLVSAFGLYFLMNICSNLIAGIFPMAQKPKDVYGPRDNLANFADILASENGKWELENAENELLEKINSKMKKLQ